MLARELRKNMGQTEWRLWDRIRMKQLEGWKFRRQHPIGEYFVDFFCPAARLVVEVDGPTHGEDREFEYDRRRDAWLEAHGYKVLRFWVNEIDEGLDDVVEAIYLELAAVRPTLSAGME